MFVLLGTLILAAPAAVRAAGVTAATIGAATSVVGVGIGTSICIARSTAILRNNEFSRTILAEREAQDFVEKLFFSSSDNELTVRMGSTIAVTIVNGEPILFFE